MKESESNPQIEYLQRRISELRKHDAEESAWVKAHLPEVIEELLTTLEELQVADEELRQQNEELAAANQAVEAERRRYLELFNLAPDGYIVTDKKGIILEANRSAAALLNVGQEFLPGKPFLVYLSEGERKSFHVQLAGLAGNERIENWETVMQPRDGELFYASITVGRIRDGDGKSTGYRYLIRDVTERKNVEKELTKYRGHLERLVKESAGELLASNELLERILSNTHVLIAYMDTSFNFIRVNNAYAKADERDPDFYVGRNHFDLFPNKENEEIFRRVAETGEPYSVYAKAFEYAEHPERSVTHWDWSLIPVTGASEEVEGVLLCLVEVTDRVRAEQELRRHHDHLEEMVRERTVALSQANRRLTNVLGSTSDGFITLDNNLVVTFFNKAAEQLLGRKAADVLGRPIFEAFPEAKGSIFEERYRLALREKIPLAFETYSGSKPYENWYDVRVYPHEGGLSVYFQITTERKRAEQELHDSLHRFKILTDVGEELLRPAGPQTMVEGLCQKVMEHLDCHACLNYLTDERVGKLRLNAWAGILPEEAEKMRWLDYEVTVSGCAARDGKRIVAEHIPTTPDERTELVKSYGIKAYACHPLLEPGGKVIGTLSFGTKSRETFSEDDLSLMKAVADMVAVAMNRLRYEEALRESEAEYRLLSESLDKEVTRKVEELRQIESLAAMGRMVATVAHEVRNPLQNIQMGIDFLRKRIGADKDNLEILEETEYGVKILNEIVSDLLEYAKPLSLHHSLSSLRNVCEYALKNLSSKLGDIDCKVELERGGIEIYVDDAKLTSVLLNIISNAADAMPAGGVLTIRSRLHEEGGRRFVKISITDTGHGIDEENLDKLFQPFFTTKSRGVGLGLAACRKIVTAHKGNLEITSQVGKGTTVELTLPVDDR